MSLTTTIYVLDKVDPKHVFVQCNRLLGATEATAFRNKQVEERHQAGGWVTTPTSPWKLGNLPGQDLPAHLDVTYRTGGPYRTAVGDCEWICANPCDFEEPHTTPAAWVEVTLDTNYGYRDVFRRVAGSDCLVEFDCGDLHAMLVAQFGQWLTDRRVRFKWENESTGEVFDGFDGLPTLCGEGRHHKPAGWFDGNVKPATELEAAAHGLQMGWVA